MTYQEMQLSWMHQIHDAMRSSFTDTFFILWNYVDTPWFILLFVSIITYLFNRKEGIAFLFIFLISGIVNQLLKGYFMEARPFQVDPTIGLIYIKGFSFPSGSAQTATLIAGAAIAKCKMPLKILGTLFALLLCFSRIYLGVHYPSDILGGILAGLILLVIYLKVFPLLENHWAKFAFALSLLFLVVKQYTMGGVALGLACGLALPMEKEPKGFLTLLVVLIGSAILLFLDRFSMLFAIFTGLWFIYLGPKLIQRCR
ncbi:MAG: phosphatase PAP2 family protein [Simkaniaceae bacterium]|nr:phosphatase PAP2 family protein [Simkaniaceae bacterium]